MKNTFENALINLAIATKGCKDASLIALTDARIPDYVGLGKNVQKLAKIQLCLGGLYEKRCNDRAIAEYKAEKPNGKTWVKFPYILRSDKDENVFYIRTYPANGGSLFTENKAVYLVDGRVATANEYRKIMDWKATHQYSPAKQLKAGISADNIVKCFDYKLSNIIEMRANGHRLNRLEWSNTQSMETAQLIKELY